MVDRLRALLDRPLDPGAARAILVFSSAILVGFAALLVLAVGQPDQPTSSSGNPSAVASSPGPAAAIQQVEDNSAEGQAAPRRQDPQDVEGSAAARRAARALSSHRAIQHVPYRRGELAITLVGAKGDRALLRVSASNLPAARRGWREFLHRYRDRGTAYIARFVLRGEGNR
ncbi:MAG: hypothetical protein ACM3Q9_02400 [Methanosarcina sp.]